MKAINDRSPRTPRYLWKGIVPVRVPRGAAIGGQHLRVLIISPRRRPAGQQSVWSRCSGNACSIGRQSHHSAPTRSPRRERRASYLLSKVLASTHLSFCYGRNSKPSRHSRLSLDTKSLHRKLLAKISVKLVCELSGKSVFRMCRIGSGFDQTDLVENSDDDSAT